MKLLKELCSIHAPSGSEKPVLDFLINYIKEKSPSWSSTPAMYYGDKFMDCLVLVFGTPKTAIYAHMDSIGFTVRYQNQLVAIGGPDAESGQILTGFDDLGPIECRLVVQENQMSYDFPRGIAPGTPLTFKCDFRESEDYITSCSLDNRLGVYNALRVAETLTDGMIIFSCWEEHGGGSVPFLARFMVEEFGVYQALISDITWITEGVIAGKGVAVSMRDRNIPRRSFIDKIIRESSASGIPYQIEVEGSGSSDGRELQQSSYPIDWCFIGAAEQNVHSPNEKVHKADIDSMISLYQHLMKTL